MLEQSKHFFKWGMLFHFWIKEKKHAINSKMPLTKTYFELHFRTLIKWQSTYVDAFSHLEVTKALLKYYILGILEFLSFLEWTQKYLFYAPVQADATLSGTRRRDKKQCNKNFVERIMYVHSYVRRRCLLLSLEVVKAFWQHSTSK